MQALSRTAQAGLRPAAATAPYQTLQRRSPRPFTASPLAASASHLPGPVSASVPAFSPVRRALIVGFGSAAAVFAFQTDSASAQQGGSNSMATTAPTTLYDFPLAYNPAKARIMLVEKNIPYEAKVVNILSKAGVAPDFVRLNPEATLPVLKDGNTLLTQSKDIVEYLNARDGKPLGGDKVDQAKVKEWIDLTAPWDGNLYVEAANPSMGKIIGAVGKAKKKAIAKYSEKNPDLKSIYDDKLKTMEKTGSKSQSQAEIDNNKRELAAICDKAEATLANSPYLAGPTYSAADAMLSVIIWRVGMANKTSEYLGSRPNLSKWFNGIKARPSYNKVFGPASSPFTALPLVAPALFGALFA